MQTVRRVPGMWGRRAGARAGQLRADRRLLTMAERGGFEPPRPFGLLLLLRRKSSSINHSDTSPNHNRSCPVVHAAQILAGVFLEYAAPCRSVCYRRRSPHPASPSRSSCGMLRPGRTAVGWYIVMHRRSGDSWAALGPFDRPTAEWYLRHDPGIRRPAQLAEAASEQEAVAKLRQQRGSEPQGHHHAPRYTSNR